MIQTVEIKGMGVNESEIKWVLTVPAMWLDPAKQVITEAAELVCFFHFFAERAFLFLLSKTFFPLILCRLEFLQQKFIWHWNPRQRVYTVVDKYISINSKNPMLSTFSE